MFVRVSVWEFAESSAGHYIKEVSARNPRVVCFVVDFTRREIQCRQVGRIEPNVSAVKFMQQLRMPRWSFIGALPVVSSYQEAAATASRVQND